MILTIILSVALSALTTWLILCWYNWNQLKHLDKLANTIENLIDAKLQSNIKNNSIDK